MPVPVVAKAPSSPATPRNQERGCSNRPTAAPAGSASARPIRRAPRAMRSIFFNQSINVVIVDPANNQIVYLASNFGFFRSTDGGLNWTQARLRAGP